MPLVRLANTWQTPGERWMGGIGGDGMALRHLRAGFRAGLVLFVLWGWGWRLGRGVLDRSGHLVRPSPCRPFSWGAGRQAG